MTRWIEDWHYDPRFPFWTRANVGEVLPEPPSPLGWSLVFEPGCLMGWRDCMVDRLGIGSDEVHPTQPPVMGTFGGYAYLGASITRIWAERTPGMSAEAIDAAYYGDHPDVPPYVAEPWHENPATTEVMERWLGWVMADLDQSELEADRVESRRIRDERPVFDELTDDELLERARSLVPMCRRMFDQHINQSAAASIGPGVIGAVCEAIGQPKAALRLIAGLGGVDSAAPSYAMWELSRLVRSSDGLTAAFDDGLDGLEERLAALDEPRFARALEEFFVEFGSRGPNEWDVHSPTWETDRRIALASIDRMRVADDDADPTGEHETRRAEREALAETITEALAADPEAQGQFVAALASAAVFVPGRERSKTSIIRVIGEMRAAVLELGRRAVDAGDLDDAADICLLFDDELDGFVAGERAGLRELVAERQAHFDWLHGLEPPFLFSGDPVPNTEWPRRGADEVAVAGAGDIVAGVPGCPGVARGRARVVLDASDPTALEPGDILVAPVTDPAWTPLFVPAAGVVVDVGAPLSHAIIVSRELGIPCVVSATGATRRIPDGATVEVDGATGKVTVVSVP
ncbi:MAG: PEP-utilizing enzyme [Actinomycetota bacterium]